VHLLLHDFINHVLELGLALQGEPLADQLLEEHAHCVLKGLLNKAKLLVDFVPEDLAKETDVCIFFGIALDASNDGSGPFDDELLQSVSLVQVSVHVLLHGLSLLLGLEGLLVVLLLASVDVDDKLSQLLEAELLLVLHLHWGVAVRDVTSLGCRRALCDFRNGLYPDDVDSKRGPRRDMAVDCSLTEWRALLHLSAPGAAGRERRLVYRYH